MRLVCPNCDAEYEVDDAAIPAAGRDVQCSNCGHAWFQTHPEAETTEVVTGAAVAARPHRRPRPTPEPEPALAVAEPADEAEAPEITAQRVEAIAAELATVDPVAAEVVVEAAPAVSEPAPIGPRNIDESVLAVLREEAAREAAARRAETPAIETQTEMPLEPAANRRATPPPEPEPEPRVEVVESDAVASDEPAAAVLVRSRGDRLPAIDEINSTLRATSDRSADADDVVLISEPRARSRADFGRGFLLVVLLGVIILALYVFAPLVGAKVPALAGAADAYVAGVNTAREWVDVRLRSLVGFLDSYKDGQSG